MSIDIHNCNMCPRNCGADRTTSKLGYCGINNKVHISEICVHKGEEPILGGENGVCNVFFSSCNLKCVYCQNYEISQNKPSKPEITSAQIAAQKIANILCKNNINTVGFVSPSHQTYQMRTIIDLLRKRGFFPTIIYNTNAYDNPQTLRELEGYVDIYLPDYKYSDAEIASELSSAKDYPQAALAAIKEMYYQKGATIITDENGIATNGLIIRHLVLPNRIKNSIKVLENIAYEISPRVHISLMSQYYPEFKALESKDLNRCITETEYKIVAEKAEKLGITRGWFQQIESNKEYRPNFNKKGNPFEKQ